MKKIHFTDRYLLNPRHPVTVFVIGAGGTGSQVITNLARMSMALQALGHPGLHVTVFDPDTVSQANIGRQLFSETELGLNKAVSLVTRINRFFGYAWTAEPQCFPTRNFSEDSTANIIITCTDNIRSRLTLWKFLKKVRKENFSDHSAPIYWMDFGNSQTKGQVIIGTVREKVLQPSSQEYIPMPKMNVITEEGKDVMVEPAAWSNMRYHFNEVEKKIEECSHSSGSYRWLPGKGCGKLWLIKSYARRA